MGDFNSLCDSSIDKSNQTSQHKKPSEIIQLLQHQDFIDSYRFLHPDKRSYTWKSSSDDSIQTRIDYIWFSDDHLNLLAHSDIIDAANITGSDHNITTLTLDTHLFIRNHATSIKRLNNRSRQIYQYHKMNSPKWLKFTKTLDFLVNKHKIGHKATQILLTNDSDHNRTLLSDLWGDIAKCF